MQSQRPFAWLPSASRPRCPLRRTEGRPEKIRRMEPDSTARRGGPMARPRVARKSAPSLSFASDEPVAPEATGIGGGPEVLAWLTNTGVSATVAPAGVLSPGANRLERDFEFLPAFGTNSPLASQERFNVQLVTVGTVKSDPHGATDSGPQERNENAVERAAPPCGRSTSSSLIASHPAQGRPVQCSACAVPSQRIIARRRNWRTILLYTTHYTVDPSRDKPARRQTARLLPPPNSTRYLPSC